MAQQEQGRFLSEDKIQGDSIEEFSKEFKAKMVERSVVLKKLAPQKPEKIKDLSQNHLEVVEYLPTLQDLNKKTVQDELPNQASEEATIDGLDEDKQSAGVKNFLKDMSKMLGVMGVVLVCFVLISQLALFLNMNLTSVWGSSDNKRYATYVSFLMNEVMCVEYLNYMRLYFNFKHSSLVQHAHVKVFRKIREAPAFGALAQKYIVFSMLCSFLLDVPLGYLLFIVLDTFELNQIYFILVIAALNFMKILCPYIGWAAFKLIFVRKTDGLKAEELEEFNQLINQKTLIVLGIFRVLPFCQLACSFIGEIIAPLLPDPRYLLFFCLSYPILMGIWQKLMAIIDEHFNLELEFLGESYSLMYSVLPYKMVYLSIDDFGFAMMILGIKLLYKTIAYIFVPLLSKCKPSTSNRLSNSSHQPTPTHSRTASTPHTSQTHRVSLTPEHGTLASDQPESRAIKLRKLLRRLFDDPEGMKELFLNKFMILQSNDILINICVIAFLLTDKFVLTHLPDKSMDRSLEFIEQFVVLTVIELGLDLFILLVYGFVLRWMLFDGMFCFYQRFINYSNNFKSHLILASLVLFLVCYYIRYNIKFTAEG